MYTTLGSLTVQPRHFGRIAARGDLYRLCSRARCACKHRASYGSVRRKATLVQGGPGLRRGRRVGPDLRLLPGSRQDSDGRLCGLGAVDGCSARESLEGSPTCCSDRHGQGGRRGQPSQYHRRGYAENLWRTKPGRLSGVRWHQPAKRMTHLDLTRPGTPPQGVATAEAGHRSTVDEGTAGGGC